MFRNHLNFPYFLVRDVFIKCINKYCYLLITRTLASLSLWNSGLSNQLLLLPQNSLLIWIWLEPFRRISNSGPGNALYWWLPLFLRFNSIYFFHFLLLQITYRNCSTKYIKIKCLIKIMVYAMASAQV